MHYVYVLHCVDSKNIRNKFYVGSTQDYKKRIEHHKNKMVRTTKSFDDIKLVYLEMSLNKKDSRKREIQLKTGFGRGYIKRRIANYLKESRV